MANPTRNVTTSVSEDEHTMLKAWVARNGTTLSSWSRSVLIEAIPFAVREHYLKTNEFIDVENEFIEPTPALEAPKHHHPAAPMDPMQELKNAPRKTMHTCMHIKDYFFPPFNGNSCEGTCSSPRQTGKPCHWAAGVANNCPAFQSFNINRR